MKRLLILFVVLGRCVVGPYRHRSQTPALKQSTWRRTMRPTGTSSLSGGSATSLRSTTMPRNGAAHMDLTVGAVNGFAGVFQNLGRTINPGAQVTLTGFHKSLIQPFNATRELKLEWQGMPNPPQLRVDSLGPIGTNYEQFSLSGVAPPGTTGLVVTYAISTLAPVRPKGVCSSTI